MVDGDGFARLRAVRGGSDRPPDGHSLPPFESIFFDQMIRTGFACPQTADKVESAVIFYSKSWKKRVKYGIIEAEKS